ncbi:MAG: histidinol-phosphate transaminase [bacterium]|nr:histidinol-phosphate transaminase [bacterium]
MLTISRLKFSFVVRIRPTISHLIPYDGGPGFEEMSARFGAEGVAMLAGNEYPMPPFPEVGEAIAQAASGINRYPNATSTRLREALAETWKVPPECVWTGAGSSEILTTTAQALGGPGTSMVFPWPSFAMYPINTIYADSKEIRVPLDSSLKIDLEAMAEAIEPDTTLVIICNPNNPTGSYLARSDIQAFIDRVPESTLVLVDEAYGEFVAAEGEPSLIPLSLERPNLAVARTFSKIYGLAGLRVGYLIGQAACLQALRKAQSPFVVGSVAEAAAVAALGFQERVRERFALNRSGIDFLEAELGRRGIEYVPSQANFVWFRPGARAPQIVQALLEMGTMIRKGTSEWARVTVGTDAENRRFVRDLDRVLST